MYLERVLGVKRGDTLAVVLVLVSISLFVSFSTAPAVAEPTYTYDVVRNIYAIHDFGDIIVVTLNRSALQYLGDGYWLLVLPDMDLVTFSEKVLREVVKYVQPSPLRIFIDAAPEGFEVRARAPHNVNVSAFAGRLIEAAKNLMREFNAPHANILLGPSPTIFIESKKPLDAARAAEILSKAWGGRITVVEILGWGVPSYFDAPDLYENLIKIPCFVSAGDSPIGVDIWFNITCVEDLAKSSREDFNTALSGILSSVKALNPVIRRYMPHQDIVIVIARPPPESVPLPGEPTPITTTTSRAEEIQSSNAVSSATSTWASPPTSMEVQNPETAGMGRNLTLVATTSSTVAAALILVVTYRRILIKR